MKNQLPTAANTLMQSCSRSVLRVFPLMSLLLITMIGLSYIGADPALAQTDATDRSPQQTDASRNTNQIDLATAIAAPDLDVGFTPSKLQNVQVTSPTSLQFGPDDRLYVSEQYGLIKVFTITRNAKDNYTATMTETITLIQQIPNHNDDGSPAPAINTRQVTGLLVTGTAGNPVLYVSSSDPRITKNDQNPPSASIDTNSGIVSRLRWNGSSWDKVDLVRGLPRSKENHAVNGMALDTATNTLYLMVGGNTNMGAPSTNFSRLPEFALAAALLTIDLDAIGNTTYDLPTLDDEDRAGTADANDPFGGNMGKNQAIVDPTGPVQIYSTGWRNAYDVVRHSSGELYSVDNGANAGWGGVPASCANTLDDGGKDEFDILQHISGPGYYAGHPNPTRGSQSNTFNSTNPQSPVPAATAVECTHIDSGEEPGALAVYGFSTNGIAEYTASNFTGAMQGNLLTASFGGHIWRMQLDATGAELSSPKELLFTNFDTHALDVTAQPDGGIFPGTIWVSTYFNGPIWVFEPNDYGNANPNECTGADDANLDEDNDGYHNADEIDNNTNPCSAGSLPADYDKDFVSDLNDNDDDGDGHIDTADLFALDKLNGAGTDLPVTLNWNNGDPNPGGILNLGFTGLMSNGTDYSTLYDPEQIVPSGAAGIVTLNNVPGGDAYGNTNTQQYGLQFGINVDQNDANFTVHTQVKSPFADKPLKDKMSVGAFFGKGDQDNYLKAVVAANGGAGGIQVVLEESGNVTADTMYGPADGVTVAGAASVDLMLHINPVTAEATVSYRVNEGPQRWLGSTLTLPANWFTGAMKPAVGLIATSAGATAFPASWDFLTVTSTPDVGPSRIYLPLVTNDASSLLSLVRRKRVHAAAVPNEAPVANPGAPQVVVDVDSDGTQPVQLVGSGSYDLDEGDAIVAYAWSNESGIEIPATANPVVDFPVGTHVVTLTVTDQTDATNSKSVQVTVLEASQSDVYYRVNAGGGVTPPNDGSSVTWSADSYQAQSIYLSGADLRTYVTSTTVGIDDPSVLNSSITEGMMRAERYLETGGEADQQMSWDFPLPNNTTVELRIYLAEIWFTSPDDRLFSIAVEGSIPDNMNEINMFTEAGANNAFRLSHVVEVADGNLDVDFISIIENPSVKAIEIIKPGATPIRNERIFLPFVLK